MRGEGRVLYHNGMVTVTELTETEKAEYRKLKPGVYQTSDRIRSVAVQDGEMRILDMTADGVNRIRFRL
mgnify:CR=1 FL=1